MLNPSFLDKRLYIDNVSGRLQEVAFNSPVHLPFGKIGSRPSIIVESMISSESGTTRGVAEGASLPMPIPLYDDCSGNLGPNVVKIANELRGKEYSIGELQEAIASVALGGSFATARMAVESSIIDAAARLEGGSVYAQLTGENDPISIRVPYGKSITEVEKSKLLVACRDAVAAGAGRLKFKISPDSFSEVYPTLHHLMQEFPNAAFMVDANGMFDAGIREHVSMLGQLDEMGLLTIEEPVSRAGQIRGLEAHRILRGLYRFSTPITMDDAIKTTEDAEHALDEDLADIVNLKPGRVGSFLKCIDMAHSAARYKKQIMVGGMFEASPGRYMTTTLAAYCMQLGFTIPGDLSLPSERLVGDLGTDRLSLDSDGNVVFQPKEGWGYDITQL